MDKSCSYTTVTRDFSDADLIFAPISELLRFSRPKAESFPNASFIWPFGCTRFHAIRPFTPKGRVVRAEAEFLCDNLFDLWLNGERIAADTKHLTLTDITKYVCEGENNLHLRGYQSATYKTFSSAISGGVRLFYENGETEDIVTDNSFRQIQLVNFWETEEPDGFETVLPPERRRRDMNVCALHPIAQRRSFYFKKTFELSSLPVSARLCSTALGCYEPYLNGKRITDSFFMPFFATLRREYQEFDILPMLKVGKNTIGAITGNGWYNCSSWGSLKANIPAFLATVELTYADGTREYIKTDESWVCAPSPLVENDLQYGERYDARLEIQSWCEESTEGFVAVDAKRASEYSELLLQSYPFVKKMKEHKPKLLRILPDGSPMFDIGVCVAGRMRISFRGLRRGQDVRIRYCERLADDGISPENGAYTTVFYQNDCAADGKSPMFLRNMDVYTARGDAEETYECRFSYTGYRYIWIEGLDSTDQLLELVPFELRTELCETGKIETPDAAINKIFAATKRSWLNNVCNGPTDCPTREKNFWNGDSEIFSHTACWLTDNSSFLARWTDNGKKMHSGPAAWEDEEYEMPLTLYRFYGDRELLRRRFPVMLRLIEKRTEYEGMILPEDPNTHEYCDWLSPKGVTPDKLFFKGCWFCHMLTEVANVAEIIGETQKCRELREWADKAKAEFNRLHFIEEENDYDARCQCGIVLPIAFGIAPKEKCADLAATLVKYIEKEDCHLSTGFIGTRFIFEVLADHGYSDVAYKLITQDTFPSWLHMLDGGATAITESWLGTKDPDKSLSMAHFSLGSVVGWFFEYLGGIRIKDSAPAMKHIVLKPHPIKEIGSFAVRYNSLYGEIYTEWHYEGDTPVFSYRLPKGVTAEVIL